MNILCHRGAWKSENEKNTILAFSNALNLKHGFESDVRDYNSSLVISHDIADKNSILFEEVLKLLKNDKYCFAINIKSDGLVYKLKKLLNDYDIKNYFTFDMSIPQMLLYKNADLKYFTRQSEFEKKPALYENSDGIWIDSFYSDDWITSELIINHLKNKKKVCIVSPELHGRSPELLWSLLKQIEDSNLYICTDLVLQAEEFFRS